MSDRLVSVGDDYTLPDKLKVKEVNLPEYLSGESLDNMHTGISIAPGNLSGSLVSDAISQVVGSFGAGGGDIILKAGVHIWDKTPKIPHSISSKIRILGEAGSTIKLTTSGVRAFDFDWSADDQTFRNIELSGFNIDATASSGRNHIIIGNYVNGSFVGRFNVDNIRITNVNTYGALADPTTTNHPTHIHITPRHVAGGEAENTITNVYISDLNLDGGNTGIIIGGNGPNSGIEVYSDNVTIERCHFKGGITPTRFFTTSGFHIGGKGHCGRVVIRDCVSENSGDNGFEVNAPKDALIDNCLSIDAANVGFYARNFHPLVDKGHSRIEWRHCRSWIRDVVPNVSNDIRGRGFMVGGTNPFGRLLYTEGCEHQQDNPGDLSEVSSLLVMSLGVDEIVLGSFKSRISNINLKPTKAYFPSPIAITPSSLCTTRGSFSVEATGKTSGEFETIFRGASIGGTDHSVDLTGDFKISLEGFPVHTVYGFDIGEAAGSVVRGKITANFSSGSVGRGIRFRPNLTIDKSIYVSGDFSGLTTGGVEFMTSILDQQIRIHASNIIWKTAPSAPSRIPTASPFIYQNRSMYPELVTVRLDGRESSSPITSVDYTKRGGSAVGTGATSGQYYLQNGDSLTINYGSGTYPPVIRAQSALPQSN